MRILSIGIDTHVLTPSAPAHERMQQYATLADEFRILVYTRAGNSEAHIALGPNSSAQGIGSRSRLHFLHDAYRWAKAYSAAHPVEWLVTTQDPFELGLIGYWIQKKTGVRWHAQVHTDFLSPYFRTSSLRQRMQWWIARHILPHAARIRVVSNRIRDELVAWQPALASRIDVLPIWVAPPTVPHTPDARAPMVLVASRLTPEKRIEDVIAAFRLVHEEHPHARLQIAGKGPCATALQSMAKNMPYVEFLGWQDDLIPLYARASVYVLSSAFEGYGRTLIEAHAMGVPIVTTDVGVAQEVVQTPEDGRIVAVGDAHGLARGISEVLSHPCTPRPYEGGSLQEYLAQYRASWEHTLL